VIKGKEKKKESNSQSKLHYELKMIRLKFMRAVLARRVMGDQLKGAGGGLADI